MGRGKGAGRGEEARGGSTRHERENQDHEHPGSRRPDRPEQPARFGRQEHQLRRRQHLRQGHRDRPGHRGAGRVALGEGLRWRPRHPQGVRAGGAPARPDARPGRGLPGRGPRGRDGGGVRLLPARQGRRCAEHRHRHARPGRRRPRRPPAPRLRDRHRHRRRRRGAHHPDLRRPGGVGAVAPTRLPTRPRHRRDQVREPAGARLHPRRPRHHRLGRHLRRIGGQRTVDHRHRCRLHRRARQG